MKIYLICHGMAVNDELLPVGENQATEAGWALKKLGLRRKETLLVSSFTKRTLNTATIVGGTAEIGSVTPAEWLDEGATFTEFAKGLEPFVRRGNGLKQIVLVGHAPIFEGFLAVYDAGAKRILPGEVYEVDIDTDEVRKVPLTDEGGES